MTTYIEKLPERKASKHSGIRWTPAEGNEHSPLAGVLLIDTDRARVTYTVAEFPTDWAGRGFRLVKTTEGTDATAEAYSVFCSKLTPAADQCECRGFLRHRHCKHIDAVRALLDNQWI